MKRFFEMILVITAIMGLCAGTAPAEAEKPDSVAFETFLAANTTQEMLARNGDVLMTRTTWFEDAEVMTEHVFRAADMTLWIHDNGRTDLRTPDYFIDRGYADDVLFGTTIFDSAEDRAATFEGYQNEAFIDLLDGETLEKTYVTDNGRFVAETRCSVPLIVRQTVGQMEYTGSYVYADGMELVYRYTFDRETLNLVGNESFIIDAEGKSNVFQSETYEYGTEAYDPAADSDLFADYFAALSVQDELRTIRIVYDPDTAHEKTAEAVLPVNTWFSVYHNGAFMETFFSDRECTQPFYDCYVREDLVIYALSE